MPVRKVADNFGLLEKAVLALTKNAVLVGVPAGSTRPDGDIDNSAIAYIAEFGAPERNVPARPFLVPGVESIRDRAAAEYRKAGKAVLTGDLAAIETAHTKVGLIAQSAVQQKITDGPFAPLAERTLKARKAKGRTGDKPLIDTGSLRRSVTFAIRPKKGS